MDINAFCWTEYFYALQSVISVVCALCCFDMLYFCYCSHLIVKDNHHLCKRFVVLIFCSNKLSIIVDVSIFATF